MALIADGDDSGFALGYCHRDVNVLPYTGRFPAEFVMWKDKYSDGNEVKKLRIEGLRVELEKVKVKTESDIEYNEIQHRGDSMFWYMSCNVKSI